ncbi:MAG: hypothetical protein V4613_07140 [Bacteroidota bacterium]
MKEREAFVLWGGNFNIKRFIYYCINTMVVNTSNKFNNWRYKLLIISTAFAFVSCNESKPKRNIKHEVVYYEGTKIKKMEFDMESDSLVGPILMYEKDGSLRCKSIYASGDTIEVAQYGYKNNKLLYFDNIKEQTRTWYFSNGNKARFEKYANDTVDYYINYYDSITKKPIDFFRDIRFDVSDTMDIVTLEPYLENPADKLINYSFIIITHNSTRSGIRKTYYQKSTHPIFKLKKESHTEFSYIICDSLGCYTLPMSLTFEGYK